MNKFTLMLRRPLYSMRAFSLFDGFLYGIYADSLIVAAALTYSLTWPWPRANLPLGIVLVCLAFIPMFTVYAMLTTMMPRTGGDYAWQCRSFGGFWGFILVFTPLLFGPWFYMASNVAPGSVMVGATLLISLAEIFNAPGLIDLAAGMGTTTGTWWFYVFYVTFSAVVLCLGMRFYAVIQRWSFFIGMTAIVVWIFLLLTTTPQEFQSDFNRFMSETLSWGHGRAYEQILSMAKGNGFTPVSLGDTDLVSSFLIGPALAYTFMYIAWTGTLVGEIRGVKRLKNSMFLFQGGNIFSMLVCAGFLWLLLSRISNEFFTSSNFLWSTGAGGDIPVAPHYGIFLMALSKGPWLWLLTAIGLNAWFWIWPTNNMVMSTRVMEAMAADQRIPRVVTERSRRLGTPFVAILICYVGCLFMGWLYFFSGFSRLTLNMPLMTAIAFAASTLAGTLFPYLKSTKQIYKDSPVSRYTILGVPLITICGILGLIYFMIMFYLYVFDSRYGTNDPLSAVFVGGSLVVSAAGYLIYRFHKKKRGIDADVTYREVPLK